MLRLDEITAVTVPTADQEAARDLVRAPEDCRGDLMRARHRLSKLLPRHGIVYDDGAAWTTKHDRWPTGLRLTGAASQAAFDAEYETVLQIMARRDRLDPPFIKDSKRPNFNTRIERPSSQESLASRVLARRHDDAGAIGIGGPVAGRGLTSS